MTGPPAPQGQEGIHRRLVLGWAGKLLALVISVGEQVLLVPVGRGYAPGQAGEDAEPTQHKVQRGDSLWKIAMRYNVRVKDLMAWNNLSPKSILRPGDRIIVKTGG